MAGDRLMGQPLALATVFCRSLARARGSALVASAAGLALAGGLLPLPASADQGDMVNPIDARPPGLVVLWERAGRGGQQAAFRVFNQDVSAAPAGAGNGGARGFAGAQKGVGYEGVESLFLII